MSSPRYQWPLAGLVAGGAGLATSYFVAMAMTIRESPVVAVAELIIKLTPGPVIERVIRFVGTWDKPLLVLILFVILGLLFAWAGRLARRSTWQPALLFAVIAALGAVAVAVHYDATPRDLLPVLVGFVTWLICLSLLTDPLRARGLHLGEDVAAGGTPRRGFLIGSAVMVVGAAAITAIGRGIGRGRRQVEDSRRLLRLVGVTEPVVPDGANLDLAGIKPWRTKTDEFYLIHTALVPPAIEPEDWAVRIHGLVDRPMTITYAQLTARRLTEAWITLNCVSNPVGGPLVGNAWWSGVLLADLLEEAGVQAGADAIKQTAHDGWTCGTPLATVTDGRTAMLAVAMNGKPLPIDHGFPVRTIVPGLYGFVSACKWVVDIEVTRFADFDAYWTTKGWSEQAPVKIASRIDVPGGGDELPAGTVNVGGSAWAQHTGIRAVEVALDGGEWQPVRIGADSGPDTWVQWSTTLTVTPGDHVLRVRAVDATGQVQTGAIADVTPDGATGWHTVEFQVAEG